MSITLLELKTAVNTLIDNEYPNKIQSKDITEGFTRPSFFIEFDNINKDTRLYYFTRNLTVKIYFFPTSRDEYSKEILEVQEKLEELFGLNIAVKDRIFTIENTTSEIIDGVLIFEFDLSYDENIEIVETGDLMDEVIMDEIIIK
jgi:hypothetical protein